MNNHKPGETRIIEFVMILGALKTIHKAAKTGSTNPTSAKVRTKCQPLSKVITQMIGHEEHTSAGLSNSRYADSNVEVAVASGCL